MNDRTDEDNVELIQQLWREYGATVVGSIVLVILGVIGWHYYDEYQLARANEAALAYRTLTEAQAALDAEDTEGNREAFLAAIDEIKSDYPGSAYAVFAAMGRAGLLVQDDELEQARAELEWARDQAGSDYMADLARIRLARVQSALGNTQGALWALDEVRSPGMEVLTAELRGDIHAELGQDDLARAAYEEALALNEIEQVRILIEVKLNSLGGISSAVDGELIPMPVAEAEDASDSGASSEPAPEAAAAVAAEAASEEAAAEADAGAGS